jgi:segregation and condensation protein A
MADDFDAPVRLDPETLTLALGAWEGPLDVLLALARAQKVDLKAISILALVDQYLAFVDGARSVRLELAADYLVMAAWLAYLKSCLLLPPDPEADPDPHDLALRLQFQLQRLDAMREAGARLMARDRAGHDTFRRTAPEGLRAERVWRHRPPWRAAGV